MKIIFAVIGILCMGLMSVHANNPLRQSPYPQKDNIIYLNPAPLLVPLSMKQSDYLQFNLSQDKNFKGDNDILSKPVPWCMFNAHKVLNTGVWYWRFRSVSKAGEEMPWSETYSFTVEETTPQFATPPFEVLLKNLPKDYPRIYCFLNGHLADAQKKVRTHPEFEVMVDDARTALAMDFSTDTQPYKHVFAMSENFDKLNTAYQMLQYDVYADKMMANVRCLLKQEPTKDFIDNDFKAGELVYLLAATYENFYERFTEQEHKQIEKIIMGVLGFYYNGRLLGREENMFFDEHIWQFEIRRFLQASLVLYDKYPAAKEYLEYYYELWNTRGPGTGFNRDGAWHNGANYFSANAVSLCYLPTLFGYLTGTDFLQHPWYKNGGIGVAYTWLPGSLSAGFGDGHEKRNGKPLRIRSAFADFLARTTGDPYAAWYSAVNNRYDTEFETRLYRLASAKQRPANCELPADAPKAVWFRDCGEMIANSNLGDLKKNISLSFRSSPFGSGNHTHSNQNAFNLHYGGEAVFHAVGHYMNFCDPHNLLSYRNTRAHNTMLINGIGQPFTPDAYGYIVRMFNGDNISYALGDASTAYCGISNIRLWKRSFEKYHLTQTPENGFGETPLKKYRRHIFLLHPNKVVIYDELEANEKVRWDWLLHSPVKFDINPAASILTTVNKEKGFSSVVQLFCEQEAAITQTDKYAAPPNHADAQRGEDFTDPWSLTASFGPSRNNRILTIIQVEADGRQAVQIMREGNTFRCGEWVIEAELNAKRPGRLYIRNSRNNAVFSYGDKKPEINGELYSCKEKDASVLFDCVNGEWTVQEMGDQRVQTMGKW